MEAYRFPPRRHRALRYLEKLTVTLLVVGVAAAGVLAAVVDATAVPADPVVAQASVLYYRDGRTVLARVGPNNRTDVPLARVPVAVRRAVLAAEDRGFYEHAGISARGVLRAAWANLSGAGEGASTITQQYARNAYLNQERTATRKAKEATLALKLEQELSKDQVLERYLNTVYFGRNAYGIEAAALAYFNTTTDRLTLAQGALLAAVIKDPWNFDPAVDRAAVEYRWRWILNGMAELGWAGPDGAALAFPATQPRFANAVGGPLGLVVDQVEQELSRHGIPPQRFHSAGLKIVTTLDVTAERAALDRMAALRRTQPAALHAALVAVEPTTGAVRAYYGGENGTGYFDDAVAARPPGATFTPVVLAEGLRQGISVRSRWDGSSPRTFHDRYGVPLVNPHGDQCKPCTLDVAMRLSLKTPFYALAERVGPDRVRKLAVAAGVADRYTGVKSLVDEETAPTPGRTRADISLSRYPVSPADLASVYATFAAQGAHAERHFVESVSGPGGAVEYRAAVRRTRVLSEPAAGDVTAVLSAGLLAAGGSVPGRPAAGKAGTTAYGDTGDYSDAWMAGYTPQLAAVVWIGRAEPGPIRDVRHRPIAGEGLPATLWRDFLTAAMAGQPVADLPEPGHVGSESAGELPAASAPPDPAGHAFGSQGSGGPAPSPEPTKGTSARPATGYPSTAWASRSTGTPTVSTWPIRPCGSGSAWFCPPIRSRASCWTGRRSTPAAVANHRTTAYCSGRAYRPGSSAPARVTTST
ncbi:transglycosylase domain-containing protein [Micromonospora zhanjiangensis]|uniref:Transglycosylase domain-containing protein n=1 Tax=Micromonospora zhanjiangensis TaxID=1522057 RepID=A0ABV8KF68_9ACTN